MELEQTLPNAGLREVEIPFPMKKSAIRDGLPGNWEASLSRGEAKLRFLGVVAEGGCSVKHLLFALYINYFILRFAFLTPL